MVIVISLFVVFFVVMKTSGNLKRLEKRLGGSRRTKSGSYNTNKNIIRIDIPIQGRNSRALDPPLPVFLATI